MDMHKPTPAAALAKNMLQAVAIGAAGVLGTFTLIAVIYSLAVLVLPSS